MSDVNTSATGNRVRHVFFFLISYSEWNHQMMLLIKLALYSINRRGSIVKKPILPWRFQSVTDFDNFPKIFESLQVSNILLIARHEPCFHWKLLHFFFFQSSFSKSNVRRLLKTLMYKTKCLYEGYFPILCKLTIWLKKKKFFLGIVFQDTCQCLRWRSLQQQ